MFYLLGYKFIILYHLKHTHAHTHTHNLCSTLQVSFLTKQAKLQGFFFCFVLF